MIKISNILKHFTVFQISNINNKRGNLSVTKLKMKYNMKYEFNFITKIYIMAQKYRNERKMKDGK